MHFVGFVFHWILCGFVWIGLPIGGDYLRGFVLIGGGVWGLFVGLRFYCFYG